MRNLVTRESPATLGGTLECAPGRSAVLACGGEVLGALGPGRHALDPASVPFLSSLEPGATLDVALVDTSAPIEGLAIEGTFYLTDRATGAATKRVFTAVVDLRVIDPVKLVEAHGSELAAGTLERRVTEPFAAFFRRAATKHGSSGADILAKIGKPSLDELHAMGLACEAMRSLEIAPEKESSPLRVGAHVSAQWTNGAYYGAVVIEIRGDECLVKWDDGHEPTWVRKDQIRFEPPPVDARQLRVGMMVSAQWTDGGFYRARIAEIDGGRFLAKWEDGGEPTWVRADQLRLQGLVPMPPAVLVPGMRVHAAWTDGKMYPATVRTLRDGRVEIAWDDREETEWLLPVQVFPM